MKISTFVSFMLIVAGVFFLFALMASEANQQYPSANLNSSAWGTLDASGTFTSEYDTVSSINSTVSPLQEKFKVLENENAGFFTKLAAGITAIPYAVIIFPQVLFGSLQTGGTVTTGLLAAFAIPVVELYEIFE